MYIEETPNMGGGVKKVIHLTSEEFLGLLKLPEIDFFSKESIEKMKKLADDTPDKWLQFQLNNCLKNEYYEVAAHIRDIAQKRGVVLA